MMEEQALDRIHRIAQSQNVVTCRYVMKGSFEEVGLLSLHAVLLE